MLPQMNGSSRRNEQPQLSLLLVSQEHLQLNAALTRPRRLRCVTATPASTRSSDWLIHALTSELLKFRVRRSSGRRFLGQPLGIKRYDRARESKGQLGLEVDTRVFKSAASPISSSPSCPNFTSGVAPASGSRLSRSLESSSRMNRVDEKPQVSLRQRTGCNCVTYILPGNNEQAIPSKNGRNNSRIATPLSAARIVPTGVRRNPNIETELNDAQGLGRVLVGTKIALWIFAWHEFSREGGKSGDEVLGALRGAVASAGEVFAAACAWEMNDTQNSTGAKTEYPPPQSIPNPTGFADRPIVAENKVVYPNALYAETSPSTLSSATLPTTRHTSNAHKNNPTSFHSSAHFCSHHQRLSDIRRLLFRRPIFLESKAISGFHRSRTPSSDTDSVPEDARRRPFVGAEGGCEMNDPDSRWNAWS
uniref:Uncharacterized protein n=1 Tax=Mycena chlorophos TaxID=658473 RepID=A0ABQ0L3D1_MYCCL|nr:predicted protein [Mycena chlorophos]